MDRLISLQAAIDAIERNACNTQRAIDAVMGLPSAQPEVRTEMSSADDTISRMAAIEVIDAVFPVDPMQSVHAQGIALGAALAKTYVEQLPSAQPDRSLWFRIGEICIDESKGFISAGRAVEKIRELLREAERRTDDQQRNIL